jgi:AcrR family transcriptional regulator
VLDAAEAIIDREGIEALTMRRVAEELGGSAMALYRHVRDKDELLVELLDRLAARLSRPSLPADPKARLLAVWRLLHDGLAEHQWVVGVLAKGDLIAPSVLWMIDEILAASVACGFSHEQAVAAYRTVWQFTVGELVISQGLAELDRPPFVLAILEGVDARELPTLAAVGGLWRAAREGDSFDEGLVALVDGLLARI